MTGATIGWGLLFKVVVLRAGAQPHQEQMLGSGTVGEKPGHFLWQGVADVKDRSVEQYTTKRIEVTWGFRTVVTHDPDDAYTLAPVTGVTVASTNEHHERDPRSLRRQLQGRPEAVRRQKVTALLPIHGGTFFRLLDV